MTPRLSVIFLHFTLWFGFRCAQDKSREKFAILSLKPRSHNRILPYRTWAINASLVLSYAAHFSKMQPNIVFSHNLVPRFSLLPVSEAQIGENPGNEVGFLCQFKYNFYFLSMIKRPKTYNIDFLVLCYKKY